MRSLKPTTLLLPLVLAASLATAAEEKDAAYYQTRFASWTTEIAKLQKSNINEAGTDAIEGIRTSVGQAQALSAAEKLDEIAPLEQKIDVTIRFTQMRLDRLAREAAAEAADAEAKNAEASAQKAKQEADELKKRFDDLEAKGI